MDSAQDHVNLSDSLNTQVVEALKSTEKRHDEAKKRQMQHFQKLLAERDKTYADRLKVRLPSPPKLEQRSQGFPDQAEGSDICHPLSTYTNATISTTKIVWRLSHLV